MTSIKAHPSTLLDSGRPIFYPTRPFLQLGSTHQTTSHVTTIRSNSSRKTTIRVSNTTITTGLESKEMNEKVKMVGIVGDGSLSPLNSASWYEVMLHTGCDGSVLLNSTKKNLAEKDGIPNLSLRGFQVIDAVKTAVESKCPGVVSCADILALVARDAVSMLKGPVPYWKVPLGRRDGRVSKMEETFTNLPPSFANISQLKSSFASKGLNTKDLAVLSGGHTIGTSQCSSFSSRLYNFTGKGDMDPSLDSEYAVNLKKKCKPTDVNKLVEMDPGSFKTFDEEYYTLVAKKRGLFQSDAALLDDKETRDYVKLQATTQGYTFFEDFGVSMVKMGNIGVLTGEAGEIRRTCALVN